MRKFTFYQEDVIEDKIVEDKGIKIKNLSRKEISVKANNLEEAIQIVKAERIDVKGFRVTVTR